MVVRSYFQAGFDNTLLIEYSFMVFVYQGCTLQKEPAALLVFMIRAEDRMVVVAQIRV